MSNEEIYYKSAIGTDEVGTGEALRPQVFVACYVPSYQIVMLEEMGVKDSKKLKREAAIALGKELSKKLTFAKFEMTNGRLNQVYDKIPNLNQIKAIAHNFVIAQILKNENIESDNVEKIIIDQFCPLDKFHEYTNNSLEKDERLLLIEKGEDAHLAVAAASLIATYYEDEMIKQIEAEIGEELPGGNTKKVSEFAERHLSEDNSFLKKYAKTNFKSIDKYLTK